MSVATVAVSTPADDVTRKRKAVARWLLAGVAMLVIQSVLGGVTRLTGSGLSITKWDPLFGVLPPLTQKQWDAAFNGYKQIGQYKYLNGGYNLHDFKSIFFWEWLHRFWARIGLAVVFMAGFIYFLIKRYFDREMIMPMVILFILGGLQGAVGWIMVQSGLNPDDLYVSHIKLMLHFIFAMGLTCYTLWFALQLLIPKEQRAYKPALRSSAIGITALLVLQLMYGAFMAGLKAASVAPTWPTINGVWAPDNITTYGARTYSGIARFISHPIMVHFMHRTLAYILLVLIIGWAISAMKAAKVQDKPLLSKSSKWALLLVLVQVTLGILTVVHAIYIVPNHWGSFEWLAEAHQLVAMCLLLSLIANIYILRWRPAASAAAGGVRR